MSHLVRLTSSADFLIWWAIWRLWRGGVLNRSSVGRERSDVLRRDIRLIRCSKSRFSVHQCPAAGAAYLREGNAPPNVSASGHCDISS